MEFDVVVIGASTAGLHAAQLLAEGGLSVGLFEREEKHEPARRTLIVTPAFGQVLDSGIPQKVELHRSGTMRVAVNGSHCDVRFRSPDPIIERGEMTRRLTEAALAAGVEIFYGYSFGGFEDGRIILNRKGHAKGGPSAKTAPEAGAATPEVGAAQRVTARKAYIGADGALTDVGPAAGIGRPPAVPILQAEVELPDGWDPDVTQVWFDVDDTPYFYWLIPESETHGVIGLIGEPRTKMRQVLERFMEGGVRFSVLGARQRLGARCSVLGARELENRGATSANPTENRGPRTEHRLQPLAFQSSQVAMHHPRLKPWGRVGKIPVLLVGDAAGQVKVTTVGGSVTGFVGAKAAARSILNGTSYRKELKSLKRELDVHYYIRWALERLDNRGYEELVHVLGGPVQKFLGKYHRDQMASVVWKLPFIQPRLLKLGLRILLNR